MQIKNKNISIFEVGRDTHTQPPFLHQKKAMEKLDERISRIGEDGDYSGLLIMPTGSGKTRTAVQWLLQNVVDKGGKVLWVAHRSELLNQARHAFSKCRGVLRERKEFRCHLISGSHDLATKLAKVDDVVIASVQSIRSGSPGEESLIKKWLTKTDGHPFFFVIDEAHHAPARTYRHLIKLVKSHKQPFRMLGLTATPYRTAKDEQGHLAKLFPDGIAFNTNLNEMIKRGVLSKPVFKAPATNTSLKKELTTDELKKLKQNRFD